MGTGTLRDTLLVVRRNRMMDHFGKFPSCEEHGSNVTMVQTDDSPFGLKQAHIFLGMGLFQGLKKKIVKKLIKDNFPNIMKKAHDKMMGIPISLPESLAQFLSSRGHSEGVNP